MSLLVTTPFTLQTPCAFLNKPKCSYLHTCASTVPASCKDLPHGLCLANSSAGHMLHLLQEALCDLLGPPRLGFQCPFGCFHISQLQPSLHSPEWAKTIYAHDVITTASPQTSSVPGIQHRSRDSWLKKGIKTHFPSVAWLPPILPWPSLR